MTYRLSEKGWQMNEELSVEAHCVVSEREPLSLLPPPAWEPDLRHCHGFNWRLQCVNLESPTGCLDIK